jgi:hypothetical protein
VSADDSRVNEQVFHIGIAKERLMELLEDALPAPTREAFIDGIPVTVLCGKQSPLCAAAGDPQHGFKELTAILLPPDIGVRVRA